MHYNFLMKKEVFILFALVSAVSLLYAEALTYEEVRVYNNEALSISERSVTYRGGLGYSHSWSNGGLSSSFYTESVSTTTKTWDAYRGGERISKAEFFSITGYPEYEELCIGMEEMNKKRKSTGTTLTIVGGVLYISGTALMLFSIGKTEMTELYIGSTVAVVGAVPLSIGLRMCLTPDTEPDISSSFALSLADAYNKKLQAEIKINY